MSTVHRTAWSGQLSAWHLTTLIVIAAGVAPMAGVLHAGVHDWTQPEGANFYTAENWDPQGVPGLADTARFNLAQGPYVVTFAGLFVPDPETACLFVRHDDVTLDLYEPGLAYPINIPGYARTYTLNATGDGADASLVLGQGSHDIGFSIRVGNLGRLTLERGTLQGVNAVLGLDRSRPFMLFWRSRGELIVRTGATADFSEQMYIGYGGTGGLHIEADATVNSGSPGHGTFLGYDPGSSGEAIISGRWNIGSWLNVGDEGVGSMTITAGGNVTTVGAGEIAKWSGSSGQVLVSGQDALWNVGLFLRVGDEGAGELSITSGGRVNASWDTVIGRFADSTGTVNVTDTDSRLDVAGDLEVAAWGTGGLHIANHAAVASTNARIGSVGGATGQVTIDNATWTNTNALSVGDAGHATLNIHSGGRLTTADAVVAREPGSTGLVTVHGSGAAGSTWAITDELELGRHGNAQLDVTAGAQLASHRARIATGAGSVSAATVDGAGSSWAGVHDLQVGALGQGSLHVSQGGELSSNFAYIGYLVSSIGHVSLDGTDSNWANAGHLYVGHSGNATLGVSNNAVLTTGSGWEANIGYQSTASGQVTVDRGAIWNAAGELNVGRDGDGALDITTGGTVNSTIAYIARNRPHGYPIAGSGAVSVDGPDSCWNNDTELFVGYHGQGTLDIANAGSVSNRAGVIGRRSGAHGHVSVDGPDATWTNTGSLRVGFDGHGSLAITNGASVISTWASIGYNQSATGHVAVAGPGATWASSSMLVVGDAGDGALTITDGSSVHSSLHELWALRMGTQLEDRPRYTPTTCFETFPLPWPPGDEPTDHTSYQRIAEAAKELDEQRRRWLNPPHWVDPIAAKIDAEDDFADVAAVSGEEARRLIRDSTIQAHAAKDANLKRRTLTNLYNERPAWLALAHRKLDEAVLAAYAVTDPAGGWDEAWAEIWQETGAAHISTNADNRASQRAAIDRQILTNLLALNERRSASS